VELAGPLDQDSRSRRTNPSQENPAVRHAIAALALLAVMTPAAARAAEEAEAFAPVKQFIEGFNKGDEKTALAACAPSAVIIDEFAPYVWQGQGACAAWASDFDADAKKQSITDAIVKLGKPRHVFVSGDKAYVVVPTSYDYRKKGKKVSQKGATLTVGLQKGGDGWRITAWAWTTG
jgi:ketosteroid isomerase-like protein